MHTVASAARIPALLLGSFVLLASTEIQMTAHGKVAVVKPDRTPIGSIILIPGGATTIRISGNGHTSAEGNTVMRIRPQLVDAGYAVAYAEDPSDLSGLIATLRGVARPVVLLGLSNGTIVEVDNGKTLGKAGPDLIVLMSTVTVPNRSFSHAVTRAGIAQLTVPVLFVHNPNDRCGVSPPSGAHDVAEGVANATFLELESPLAPGANQCEPFSPHGFLGVDSTLARRVLEWIAAHASARADA